MDSNFKSFTSLKVWRESIELVKQCYEVTKNFPLDEKYGLTSQIRRCSISIPSNIAESTGRKTNKDRLQFLIVARGSINEFKTQLYISKELGFIDDVQFDKVLEQANLVHKLLNGFMTSLNK